MNKKYASSRQNWMGIRILFDAILGTLFDYKDLQTKILKINSRKLRIENENGTEFFQIDLSGSSVSVTMSNNVKDAIRSALGISQ